VSDALPAVLAAGPVTVTAVRAGIVHFTSNGIPVRFPVSVFRMLYQPADQAPPA